MFTQILEESIRVDLAVNHFKVFLGEGEPSK